MGTTASVVNPRNIHFSSSSTSEEAAASIPEINYHQPIEKETTTETITAAESICTTTQQTTRMLLPNRLKSDWMTAAELLSELERGDLVEIRRNSYNHWVIYIGYLEDIHCVAHISTDAVESVTKKELRTKLMKTCAATVRSDPLLTVTGADLCRVNNSLDAQRRPFPPTIIVERALQKLGTGGYHIVRNNCEHFAKWCRYNLRESNQSLIGQASAIGLASLAATTSLPYGVATGVFGFVVMKAGQALNRHFVMRSII